MKHPEKIYCITLKRSIDRHQKIIEQADRYGIDCNFCYGYDGTLDSDLENITVTGKQIGSMNSMELSISLSHLKAISDWYHDTDEPYALFCEDDIDLSIAEYWPFCWDQLIERLPDSYGVIQLALLRDFTKDNINDYNRLHRYVWDNWGATAYLIHRRYAKILIEQHLPNSRDQYRLDLAYYPDAIPYSENVIFNADGKATAYTIPLYTEQTDSISNLKSVYPDRTNHKEASAIIEFWKLEGQYRDLEWFLGNQRNSVPVIGTMVLNSTDWLKRLISSIDYPVDDFIVINNNGKRDIQIEQDLENIRYQVECENEYINRMHIIHMPSNIGVSASWNLIIKSKLMSPYWIIMNDDVAFTPGLLEEFHRTYLEVPSAGIIHAYEGDHNCGSWDLFLIRDHAVQKYGLFDENLYPAYAEDNDYLLRYQRDQFNRVMNLEREYWHGMGLKGEYYLHGSQSTKKEPELAAKLNRVTEMNFKYLHEKWGPHWRTMWPYDLPFEKFPKNYTTFDLMFIRKKYLGF